MDDNAIIQPEEDYEGWCFIFLTALQPDGDSFTILVPSYCRIINDIITTDKLPDPISDFTDIFLTNFVPDALSKVLELGYVHPNDIEKVNLFLISTSDLIPWAASHNKFDLIRQIFPVISKESNNNSKSRNSNDIPKLDYQYFNRSFYGSHSKSWKTIIQHYVDVCIPLLIKLCEEPVTSFYLFYLIFGVTSDITVLELPINGDTFKPAIDSFLNFLQNLNVHNISDISELQKSVQKYTEFVIFYFQSYIPQLIQLSEDFIKSGILDKQFLGIETITAISESTDPEVENAFSLWVSKTDLADYILSKSFNNTFYERIRPIMVKLMSKELLEKFWNNALIAHRSQRKPMFDILSKAIVSIDEQSAIEFINYVIISASSPHPSQVSLQSSSSSSVTSYTNLTPLSSSGSVLSYVSSSDLLSSAQSLIGSKLDIDIFHFLSNVARSFASTNQKMAEYVSAAIFKLAILPSNRSFSIECLTSLCKVREVQSCLFNLCCEQLSNFEIIEFICKVLSELVDSSYNLPFSRLKNAIIRIVSRTVSPNNDNNSENNENNNNNEENNREIYQENSLLDNQDQNIQLNNDDNKKDDDLDPEQFQKYKILLCNLFYKILKRSKSPITKTVVDAFTKTGIDDSLFSMLLMSLKSLGVGAFGKEVNDILIDHIIKEYNFEKASEIFSDFFVYFILKINIENDHIEPMGKSLKEINLNPNKYQIYEIPLDHVSLLFKLFCEIEDEKNLDFLMKQILQMFTQISIKTDLMIEYLIQLIDPYLTEINKRSTYRALLLIKNLLSIEKFYYIELFGYSRHIPTNFSNYIDVHVKVKKTKLTIKALPIVPLRIIQDQIGFQFNISPKYITFYKDNAYLHPGSSLSELKIKNGDTITASINQEYEFYFIFPSITLTKSHFQDKLLTIINNNDYENVTLLAVEILNTLPDSLSLSSVSIDEIKNSQSGYSFLYKLQIYTKQAKKLDSKNNEFFLDLMLSNNGKEAENPFNIISLNENTSRTISCESLKFVNEHFDEEILCNSFERIVIFCLNVLCNISLDMSTYDENQHNAISLLNKIIKADSRIVTELSVKNINRIEKIMSSSFYHQENLLLLIDLFDKFDDITPIFDICISHLNQQASSDNFVKIFSHIVDKAVDFVNLDNVFTKCLESLNPNSNPHLFCEICKAIEALINTNSSFAVKYGTELVTKLITIAFERGNPDILTSAFSISEKVCIHSKEAMEVTIKLLKPYFQKDYDFYSFKPSNNTRSPLNYTGLRNLGSTCYMNSIFQQLFYVPPFRYRIITEDFNQYDKDKVNKEINKVEDDGKTAKDSFIDGNIDAHNRLQYLFSEMLITKRKACDTQPFCSVWKGWGKQLINPHEQQDAFEFMQIFIDQFPSSISKYFRGTVKNTIRGENFETSNIEQYYVLCLAIQNCQNITDAFKNFLQSETFPQYKTDDGRIIDAEKSARINEAPPVLVLQLKRFEYDYNTFERIKINDRCEFGYTLNIRDYMVNTDQDVIYHLTGAVLHAGTALGGHYTSVINMNRRWYYFNDQEVSIINNSEFQSMAFGGKSKTNDFDAEPCAFLLFYTRAHSEANGISFFEDIAQTEDYSKFLPKAAEKEEIVSKSTPLKMSDLIKPEIREQIENDNAEFIGIQCSFSQQLFSFVMTMDDPFLLITYFINIFCHSGIDMGIKAQKTIESSIDKLNDSQLNEVFQYLVANSTKIDNILCQCTISDITDSLANVIYLCYKNLKPEDTVEYVEHFFSVMMSVVKNWRQIPQFARIIYDFLLLGNDHTQIAIQKEWTEKLIQFVNLIYEGQKSSVLINNIDLSEIFLSIQNLISKLNENESDSQKNQILTDQLHTIILQFTNVILSSQANLTSFISLVSLLSEKISIDMSHFLIVLASKEIDNSIFNDIFTKTMETVKTSEQAKNLIRSLGSLKGPKVYARYVVAHICTLISHKNDLVRQFFLNYPNETIMVLVSDNEFTLRQAAEGICSIIFSNSVKCMPDLKTYLNNNIQFVQEFDPRKEEKQRKVKKDPNYDPHSEYVFKDDQSREEMLRFYDCFISYLNNYILKNVESFYPKETTNTFVNENSYKLISFLKILKWFLLCLHNENDELLSSLQQLLDNCIKMDNQIDYNITYLCDIFALFSPQVANQIAIPLLKDMFRFVDDIQSYQTKALFVHYWEIVEKVTDQILIDLLKEPIFISAIQSIFCSYGTEKNKIIDDLTLRIHEILDENDPDKEKCCKDFILSIFNSENLLKMIDYSLENMFPLLLIISEEIPVELALSLLVNIISLIVKESYSLTYDTSRSKLMDKYNVMFFFVDYINKHKDFAFSSLTIKYAQLIEYLVTCTNLCRSLYEHDYAKESNKMIIRQSKHINNHFFHYSSLEYLSPYAKRFIGFEEEEENKPTKQTNEDNDNDNNNNNNNNEADPFNIAEKNHNKNKKNGTPIEEVTMDFIFFIAFFNMKYPVFMNSVMHYFKDDIQKKKKKKKTSNLVKTVRSLMFLCLHVTQIEIEYIENSEEEEGKNKNDIIDGYYNKFETNLNDIINMSRELPQSVLSTVFDFINAQVIELKFKLEITDIKNFTATAEMSQDEKMLSFFIEFIKSHVNEFLVESITSPATAEFYGIALTAIDDDMVTTVFDIIASSFLDAATQNDMIPLIQKLWFVMRKRPDMYSNLKMIFESYNLAEDETLLIKRDFLESASMSGFANLVFGKIKSDQNPNEEEEENGKDNDDDIFDNYKNNDNQSDDEYDTDYTRQPYDLFRNVADDDDSEDDMQDLDRPDQTSIMDNFGLTNNDITRSN